VNPIHDIQFILITSKPLQCNFIRYLVQTRTVLQYHSMVKSLAPSESESTLTMDKPCVLGPPV
jgi:hypothetical protein